MHAFTFYSLLFVALTIYASAQTTETCILPVSYFNQVVVYVGGPVFLSVIPLDASACNSSSEIIGPVYLYRPEDTSFIPRQIGFYDSLNITASEQNIPAPAVAENEYGYGYRVSIVPDRSSPSKTVWTTDTFALVTNDWITATYNEIPLYLPPSEDTLWDATAKQLIQWGSFVREAPSITSLDILLYQSQDASWGPIVLGSSIPVGPPSFPVYDYYTPAKHLPVGSNYQVVLVDHAVGQGGVLAVSGFIQIVDYSVPYPTNGLSGTLVSTIHPGPTSR